MWKILLRLGICAICMLTPPSSSGQQLQHRPPEQNPRVVVCRVIETHTSREPAAGLIVFTQRDKPDAERLRSLLLRAEEGGGVEFQVSDGGEWRKASVVRLKSCFGRGLLILSGGETGAAEGSAFLLRFPVGILKPE